MTACGKSKLDSWEICVFSGTESIDKFCFIAQAMSASQNIGGVTERLLRATQRMFGSFMRLSNSV